LGAGRDGRAYLVIQEDGRRFLDRFDPDEGKLERLELRDVEGSNFTLAAGQDGLYLAPYHALAGRYRLDWEALETAEWVPVPGGKVTGQLPPPPKP
ncbi:MAG: hypothetical protein SF066_20440, partial [Thermoanaerobaculia bacterium]|nr:hypothetical protein [Thermoanaerobaculia bacterium]